MRWLTLIQITALLLAGCGGGGGGGSSTSSTGRSLTNTASATQLMSITVTPATPSIAAGTPVQMKAIGSYGNGTSADITTSVTWSSASTAVASVNSRGVVSGNAAGTAKINATSGSISGSATVTVTAATLQGLAITPAVTSLPVGLSQPLAANGTFSDGISQDLSTAVTWSTSDSTVATVTGGMLIAVAPGTVQIGAALAGVSASMTVTVPTVATVALQSITLSPAQPSVAAGEPLQFTAIGNFSDGSSMDITSQATWLSDTPAAATVSATGLATGVETGTASISASLNGVTASTALTVTSAVLQSIAVTPATASVPAGLSQQFTATGAYSDGTTADLTSVVKWTSGTLSAALIQTNGIATGLAAGTSQVTASMGSISASATLTVTSATLQTISVTPDSPSLEAKQTQQFTATGAYSDGSSQDISDLVTWSSDTTSVATITSGGLATTLSVGTAQITATLGAVSDSTTLTVTPAKLTGIVINPTGATIAAGLTQQFTALAMYDDGSSADVTAVADWTSDSITLATVQAGLASGLAPGTANIAASYGGFTAASVPLCVTSAVLKSIAITPSPVSLPAGMSQQLVATGTYTDGSTYNLTASAVWSSGSNAIATVSGGGKLTAVSAGTTSVTATVQGVSASLDVTVTAAMLQSISVSPGNKSLAVGTTQQFAATGHYSDGSSWNITNKVTWSSTTPAVASVTSGGLATALATGTTQVKATAGTISGSASVSVTNATLSFITVTPATASVTVKGTQQFHAIGTYTDGSTQDMTAAVKWSSSNNSIATVYRGLATGVAKGQANINAAYKGRKTTGAVLTVTQ